MTAADRVRAFLVEHADQAFCDDCLSTALKIKPRQAVQQITSCLAKRYPFKREQRKCVSCKNTKLSIGSLSESSSSINNQIPSIDPKPAMAITASPKPINAIFSEDQVKAILEHWLSAQGWSLDIAWAKTRGIDIHARRSNERWIIEVKGGGSLQAMRVNYFLGVLGETLQRMNDPNAAYSIALPNIKQFRNLWSRLPQLAKDRTRISALFVDELGSVEEIT
jgi:hypothetical protein